MTDTMCILKWNELPFHHKKCISMHLLNEHPDISSKIWRYAEQYNSARGVKMSSDYTFIDALNWYSKNSDYATGYNNKSIKEPITLFCDKIRCEMLCYMLNKYDSNTTTSISPNTYEIIMTRLDELQTYETILGFLNYYKSLQQKVKSLSKYTKYKHSTKPGKKSIFSKHIEELDGYIYLTKNMELVFNAWITEYNNKESIVIYVNENDRVSMYQLDNLVYNVDPKYYISESVME